MNAQATKDVDPALTSVLERLIKQNNDYLELIHRSNKICDSLKPRHIKALDELNDLKEPEGMLEKLQLQVSNFADYNKVLESHLQYISDIIDY